MVDSTNLEKLVDGLNVVKEEFFRNKDELKVSLRKDVVAVELKSILDKTNNYDELKNAITEYIDNLYKM